ncbi:MAG: 1-acyl-sn-glycerol-3-phosphate acyltransferase [Planctomycetaceae bacterium]|nr:1-acyl-sn-glycerol-3-phosphate acyltransferase [Planctomycetaceae bacterium]
MPSRIWYRLLQRFLQLLAIVVYRVRFSGRENIPTSGGVLVVSNHQSHLDPPLVGIGVPRRMNYLARKTLFRFKPFGWLLHSVDAIPIDRDGFGLGGIKESLKRLKHDEMVVVFPEGTRTRDGQIAPFRAGFATLAVRSNAAILPAAVDGTYQAFPRGKKFPGPGRIRVRYGRPILPSEFAGRSEHELVAEAERRVRACFDALRHEGR